MNHNYAASDLDDSLSYTLGAFQTSITNSQYVNNNANLNFTFNEQPNYIPQVQQQQQQQPQLEYKTEYFTFSAPDIFNDIQKDAQRLAALLQPQKVIFIRSPETNIFSLAAKHLSARNSLDIYVLSRQTNPASLAEQLMEIKEEYAQKPQVHFIKYSTAEDVERAKDIIKSSYNILPGPQHNYNEGDAPVIDLSSKADTDNLPVVFKILNKSSRGYQTFQYPSENVQNAEKQYLPSIKLQV